MAIQLQWFPWSPRYVKRVYCATWVGRKLRLLFECGLKSNAAFIHNFTVRGWCSLSFDHEHLSFWVSFAVAPRSSDSFCGRANVGLGRVCSSECYSSSSRPDCERTTVYSAPSINHRLIRSTCSASKTVCVCVYSCVYIRAYAMCGMRARTCVYIKKNQSAELYPSNISLFLSPVLPHSHRTGVFAMS